MNTTENTKTQKEKYRPTLSLYHPNMKGTGCAIEMELHPAHGSTDGSIMLSAGNQLSVSRRDGEEQFFARFDWKNKLTVKLDFNDLACILQVMRGETETINEGRGLYHRSANGATRIVFRHIIEPVSGYSLELYRSTPGQEDRRAHFLFTPAESLGLMESIAGSMSVIAFGIPIVLPHGNSSGRQSFGESADETHD